MVVCASDRLGFGDDALGLKLMANFLRTLKEMGDELWRLVFVNNGVKLTIEGSDVLLVGGAPVLADDLPIEPTLSPEQVRALAGRGWINTDDRPRVEWEAPRYLHYDTRGVNAEAIRSAAD